MGKKREIAAEVLKDATVAVVAVGAAASGVGTPLALVVGTVTGESVALRIRDRDRTRANDVLGRMIHGDESPAEFEAYLAGKILSESPEVLAALRQLLAAALEAPTDAGLVAIANLARAHLRSRIDLWLARGGLRVFSESTDAELSALRLLLQKVTAYASMRKDSRGASLSRVGLAVIGGRLVEVGMQTPLSLGHHASPLPISPANWNRDVSEAPPMHRRVFRLLKSHAVADEATETPADVPGVDALAIEISVAAALLTAMEAARSGDPSGDQSGAKRARKVSKRGG